MYWATKATLLALCGYVAAQNSSLYSLQTIVPWTPEVPLSVDQSQIYNNTYYLSDRTNSGVHVISLLNYSQIALVQGFQKTIVNGTIVNDESGPNGLIILPDNNELWAGDGMGMVRVVDLFTNTLVANISTGSHSRSDEFAYNPKDDIVIVTNGADNPPFMTAIGASNRTVLGRWTFTDLLDDIEQPVYNAVTNQFLVSIPSSEANPGGEIRSLDMKDFAVGTIYPLPPCHPAGIVFGANQHLFVSCSQGQIVDYNVASAFILDMANGGKVIANISGVAGSDQATYDPINGLFFMSAYRNLAGGLSTGAPLPYLTVVNATSYQIVQNIPTDNITAHSIATNPQMGQVVVPLMANGIEIFKLTASNSSVNRPTYTAVPYTGGPVVGRGVEIGSLVIPFAISIWLPEELLHRIFYHLRILQTGENPKLSHKIAWSPLPGQRRLEYDETNGENVRTLKSISLASKACHRIIRPILYRTLDLIVHSSSAAQPLLRMFASAPETALSTTELRLGGWEMDCVAESALHPAVVESLMDRSDGLPLSVSLRRQLRSGLNEGKHDAQMAMLVCCCTRIEVLEVEMPVNFDRSLTRNVIVSLGAGEQAADAQQMNDTGNSVALDYGRPLHRLREVVASLSACEWDPKDTTYLSLLGPLMQLPSINVIRGEMSIHVLPFSIRALKIPSCEGIADNVLFALDEQAEDLVRDPRFTELRTIRINPTEACYPNLTDSGWHDSESNNFWKVLKRVE
ncbi:hypothetical protein LTR85_002536 [Meristemomyces frigidus]|nr:hypothetical protein LTR85_002536 [Meristemomyces frigidus]